MAIKKVVNINVNGNSMQCRLNSRTDCRFLVEFGSYRLHVELSGIPDGHKVTFMIIFYVLIYTC